MNYLYTKSTSHINECVIHTNFKKENKDLLFISNYEMY